MSCGKKQCEARVEADSRAREMLAQVLTRDVLHCQKNTVVIKDTDVVDGYHVFM